MIVHKLPTSGYSHYDFFKLNALHIHHLVQEQVLNPVCIANQDAMLEASTVQWILIELIYS